METTIETGVCYACSRRIGLLRSVFGGVETSFESAFEGRVRASFCSRTCADDAIANAAAVRRTFPEGLTPPNGSARGPA